MTKGTVQGKSLLLSMYIYFLDNGHGYIHPYTHKEWRGIHIELCI